MFVLWRKSYNIMQSKNYTNNLKYLDEKFETIFIEIKDFFRFFLKEKLGELLH